MYLQAIPLLLRNPALLLAPLFTSILGVLVQEFSAPAGGDLLGGLTGGIMWLLIFLFNCFGLGISIIIADRIWRGGRGSFEEGWEEGRRKAGDIFMAAFGLSFLIAIAQQVGGMLGSTWVMIALQLLVTFFLIFTIPAAAIGGTPGFMALNASIERVRENYPLAIGLTICFIVLYWGLGTVVVPTFLADYGIVGIVSFLIGALVRAIVLAYFALVLARAYAGIAFVRRY